MMLKMKPAGGNWFEPKARKDDDDISICLKCGCSFMELVPVKQYKRNYTTILGQKPPCKTDLEFYFLRCLKCKELYEPNIQGGSTDPAHRLYNQLLDQIEEAPETDDLSGEKL